MTSTTTTQIHDTTNLTQSVIELSSDKNMDWITEYQLARRRVRERLLQEVDAEPAFDLDSTLTYRVKLEPDSVLIRVYDENKRVGALHAHLAIKEGDCEDEIQELREKFPQLRTVLAVATSSLNGPYRGTGVGRRMYLTLMRVWFDRHGPFILLPDACNHGFTSESAQRVWVSLKRALPSVGQAVAVLRRVDYGSDK